jgi:ABC-type multidrug transport system ATPase subunit
LRKIESGLAVTSPTPADVPPETGPAAPRDAVPLLAARDLVLARGGVALIDRLSFDVGPGLTLVRGGDGRGKTTLLRLMAGELAPDAGALRAADASPYLPEPTDAAHDGTVARAWLDAEREAQGGWDLSREARLLDGFALGEHLGKELFRLSAGTRRKLGLVAAFAGGARLALLDTPFAGLDGPSRALLAGLLAEAASHRSRGWVFADHALPASLARVRLAATIDLGD